MVEMNPRNRIYDLFFNTLISILLIILPIAAANTIGTIVLIGKKNINKNIAINIFPIALLARPVTIIDKQKTGSIENNLDNP